MDPTRQQMRQLALADLRRLVDGLAHGDEHIIALSDYEVANLKELFRAMGYAAVVERNPLMVGHNGDWLAQIGAKLPHVETKPNEDWQTLARRANEFR